MVSIGAFHVEIEGVTVDLRVWDVELDAQSFGLCVVPIPLTEILSLRVQFAFQLLNCLPAIDARPYHQFAIFDIETLRQIESLNGVFTLLRKNK